MNQHDEKQLIKLLDAVYEEAQAALSDGTPKVMEKALDNIRAMARYKAEVDAVSERTRSAP